MAINELGFNQLATVLAEITSQATGQSVLAPVDTASFVSVANTALLTGYDTLLNAVSQVLSRTIFSIRPYNRTFGGLEVSSERFGNHIRKLQAIDLPFEEDDRIKLVDGESIDQYKVLKPKVLQTNYYGENVYQKHMTIFRDQMDIAFSSPAEFGRFVSMIMTNASNQIEQAKESVERATVCNLIAGTTVINTPSVFHLVTLYNDFAGTSLDSETVFQNNNFAPFVRWLCAFLANVIDRLKERSALYHLNITNKTIMRHTPKNLLKVYFSSQYMNLIETNVFSTTFHDDYLKKVENFSKVTFWQNIETPHEINVTAGYINNAGTVASSAVNLDNVFGVMFDTECAMITTVNEWQANSPFNARGGYSNMFWHWTNRYCNDFTENCVVLLLD